MKKNKKRLLIIIIAIIIFLTIGIIISNLSNKTKQYNSVSDFENVKEIVQYFDCEYKGEKDSKEDGFSKDIYLKFIEEPIDEDGYTNDFLYEQILSLISEKMNGKNFRIIDEEKNIIVRVFFNEDETIHYTINNMNNYFENIKSAYSVNNIKEDEITNIDVESNELQTIINNNWIRRNINLGEITSSCENYDIYWEKGYKIRTINNKIYNIIFTKKYQGEVLKGITTGMTNEEIKKVLGTPTYENDAEIEVIGYKLQNFYAFFSDGEISIYRLEKYNIEENNKFAGLVTTLLENKDYNSFLLKVTEIYPDYSEYTHKDNFINIKYPLRGFEITFGNNERNGITLYNNYEGKITDEISLDDIKQEKKIPANIYLNLENNLVFNEELYRAYEDILNRVPIDTEEMEKGKFAKSNEYSVYYNGTYGEYSFYSVDRNNADFKIRVQNTTGIYNITNNLFVYGVRNDGIYVVNTYTMKVNKIISSNGDNIIDRIENDTIYYDNTSTKLEY